MKIGIIVRRVMVLGAIVITTAIIGCGGDDKVTNGDEEPVADVTIEPVKLIPQNPKPSPMPLAEDEGPEPEPQSEEPEAVQLEPEKPPLVEPPPDPPQPENPQPDERELAEIAEREARFFLATNRDRIRNRVRDLSWDNPDAHPSQFFDEVYKEEFGFGLFFIIEVLLPILEEEQPEQKEKGLFISEPFIIEYTILKFQHPDKNEDELLELFRVSAREGNISIIPGEQKPLLNQAQRKLEPNREGCVPKAWIGNKWLEEFLQAPLPEDPGPNLGNLDKARVLWKRYEQIFDELGEQNPNMDWSEKEAMAYKEAFGFNRAVWEILYYTYEEEMGIQSFGIIGGHSLPPLLEYVRLSFEFPNEDPDGLLCLLRESVRAGNVSAFSDNPKPWLID